METTNLSEATQRILRRGDGIPQLDSLAKVHPEVLQTHITGFDHMFIAFSDPKLSEHKLYHYARNTQTLKRILPELPTITSLADSPGASQTFSRESRQFIKTIHDMKKMLDFGTSIRHEAPIETPTLDLDLKHPEALLFHLEDGASPEGLAFATLLHTIELYFNQQFQKTFNDQGFEPRKDWLLDVCIEIMIMNESPDPNDRNEPIHSIFDLVNNQLHWLDGYDHIDSELLATISTV